MNHTRALHQKSLLRTSQFTLKKNSQQIKSQDSFNNETSPYHLMYAANYGEPSVSIKLINAHPPILRNTTHSKSDSRPTEQDNTKEFSTCVIQKE